MFIFQVRFSFWSVHLFPEICSLLSRSQVTKFGQSTHSLHVSGYKHGQIVLMGIASFFLWATTAGYTEGQHQEWLWSGVLTGFNAREPSHWKSITSRTPFLALPEQPVQFDIVTAGLQCTMSLPFHETVPEVACHPENGLLLLRMLPSGVAIAASSLWLENFLKGLLSY